ncbi:MAG: hypothetical protein MUP47_03140 [Phycisphaerae bacterium]|nr:hypothetical protein [Phycisphaerae bacterium]
MTGIADIAVSTRLVTMTVPVAVYFLILGLLHTRRRPQMLTGRADFALMIAALSPLVFLPAMSYLGGWGLWALAAAAGLAGAVLLLSGGGRSWVVYNISPHATRDAVGAALRAMHVNFARSGDRFVADAGRLTVTIETFPLLRNATIRLTGGQTPLARTFQDALARRLEALECQTSPMAVSMLLVAVVMLAAPLAMMAQDAPQIVRLLTDLLQ